MVYTQFYISCLRRPVTTTYNGLPGELVQLINHLKTTCIMTEEIKCWTEKDPLLSRLCRFVISGRPADDLGKEFEPFVSRQKELSVLNGYLLWGSRLIIPPQGRKYLLDELHETHLGSSRMKS